MTHDGLIITNDVWYNIPDRVKDKLIQMYGYPFLQRGGGRIFIGEDRDG